MNKGRDPLADMSAEQRASPARALRDVPKLELIRLRRVVDREVERSKLQAALEGRPITCGGSGCNSCCRGDIEVSGAELIDLLPRIPARAFVDVLERAEEIEDDYRRTRAPCPILDKETGLCPIYEHRPLVCRIYQVVSPPEQCTVVTGAAGRPVARLVPNQAMALIIKAMDEEYSLLLEMLRIARLRVEEQRGAVCLMETNT